MLFFLLLFSIAVRLPNLDRPISKHHEFCTALTLVTFDIWNKKGAAHFHYSPVTNYQNPPDLSINNGTVPFVKDGTHYYLSHPPLGFWMPYYTFKFLGLAHSNRNLQLFNLLFHLLAAICVFFIAEMLLAKTQESVSNPHFHSNKYAVSPSLIAVGIFLFSPALLWYGCNVYFSDIFVNQLFVITVWAGLKSKKSFAQLLQGSSNPSKRLLLKIYAQLLVFNSLVLATMLTEWIGYFLVASVGVYSLWHFFKQKNPTAKHYHLLQMGFAALVAIAGMGITFWTYSDILGTEAFLQYLKQRFLTRTGQLDSGGMLNTAFFYTKQLIQHYASAYLPILLLFLVMSFTYFKKSSRTAFSGIAEQQTLWSYFLWIALPPILLHHFLFINYTAIHEYAVVKMVLPLSMAVAFLYQQIHTDNSLKTKWVKFALPIVFVTCLLQYFYINRVGDYSWRGHRYDQFERLGAKIRQTAKADEMVFVEGDIEINFQLVYYAKRNIWRYENPEQMEAVLKHFGQSKGIVIKQD